MQTRKRWSTRHLPKFVTNNYRFRSFTSNYRFSVLCYTIHTFPRFLVDCKLFSYNYVKRVKFFKRYTFLSLILQLFLFHSWLTFRHIWYSKFSKNNTKYKRKDKYRIWYEWLLWAVRWFSLNWSCCVLNYTYLFAHLTLLFPYRDIVGCRSLNSFWRRSGHCILKEWMVIYM